jgi:single-strand DNA-binding protein
MNLNKVILGGRLANQPELRVTASGVSVCSFSIAVNRVGKDQEADFFEVTAFKERAELVARSFKKGSNILVSGKLRQDRFTTKQGEKRSKITITADEIVFVDKKETAPEFAPPASAPTPPTTSVYNPYAPGGSQTSSQTYMESQNDGDLPF